MFRHQINNTTNKSQANTSPLKSSCTTTVGPMQCNITEAREDIRRVSMNMLEVLKKEGNKYFREIYKNTSCLKVEINE